MLKLLIADDERIIRETIFNIIDWKKHDIEVIGLCKNGIEAYDMILDESPDIVLTDIRMPGMGGLELIRKIRQTDLQIQFIILSGYGEFEYAKEAMSYGIRHYLLKPCNETQILECIEQCREDHEKQARERKMLQQQFVLYDGMFHSVLSSIINDCLDEKMTLEEIISPYEQYLDFHFAAYRLFYVYYLEFQGLPSFLQQLKAYMEEKMPQTILYGMYVKNTLVLFMQNAGKACDDLHVFLQQLSPEGQKITTEIREENYSSLKTLLTQVTGKLLRYSMIYYINHFHITAICNYNWVIDQIRVLYQQIQEGNREKTDQAVELLNSIDNIDFLKQLAGNLFLKMASDFQTFSTVDLAQWLTKMEKEEDLDPLRTMISDKFRDLVSLKEGEETVSPMVSQIYVYVEQHLQDSALTLKWIAENYLFMNVDYVSKKFYKETGQKFSQYLTKMRIGKAKELITKNPEEPIKNVAEQVGCGNNPQYFSQLFKKQTGMTPTDYITSLGH